MRILGVVCSPRKEGNTEVLVKEALEAAREAGSQTELFLVADKNISPCDGCGACQKDGICKIKDDMQELYQQMEQADGIIFGTPVYFFSVTAQAKAIMDRTYALLRGRKLRGKVAGVIVVARIVGVGQALSLLYTYFTFHRMIIARGGIGYGTERGEVRQSKSSYLPVSALEEARAVGKSVARLGKQLLRGKS